MGGPVSFLAAYSFLFRVMAAWAAALPLIVADHFVLNGPCCFVIIPCPFIIIPQCLISFCVNTSPLL